MKKLFITLFLFCFFMFPVQAKKTEEEVRVFFDSYVSAANNFDKDLFQKYYISKPSIIRVVEKKDGTKESVNVPLQTYLDEGAKGRKIGRIMGYKNTYTNITVTPYEDDFKVSAVRNPSPGGKYPAYFIIGEDNQGNLKIKVESMNTPRQEFLKK